MCVCVDMRENASPRLRNTCRWEEEKGVVLQGKVCVCVCEREREMKLYLYLFL